MAYRIDGVGGNMGARSDCLYAQESAVVQIRHFRSQAVVSFALEMECIKDAESGEFLSRFRAFPAQVGAGPSFEDAQKSLQDVFSAYMETFLGLNGLEGFK